MGTENMGTLGTDANEGKQEQMPKLSTWLPLGGLSLSICKMRHLAAP